MTTLREAATQALEAMDKATRFMSDSDYRKLNEAIDALKVALVEDAMQKFTDVNQELQAVLGCDHCNQPLYAAIKCRVCGRVTEPVQEPVAWQWLDTAHFRKKIPADATPAHWRPLFTAPPQRKPLTEEELERLLSKHERNYDMVKFARAIEAKHGITS